MEEKSLSSGRTVFRVKKDVTGFSWGVMSGDTVQSIRNAVAIQQGGKHHLLWLKCFGTLATEPSYVFKKCFPYFFKPFQY